ncbi:unnamed protein product [Brassica rapa subsp. trilocularis]
MVPGRSGSCGLLRRCLHSRLWLFQALLDRCSTCLSNSISVSPNRALRRICGRISVWSLALVLILSVSLLTQVIFWRSTSTVLRFSKTARGVMALV